MREDTKMSFVIKLIKTNVEFYLRAKSFKRLESFLTITKMFRAFLFLRSVAEVLEEAKRLGILMNYEA